MTTDSPTRELPAILDGFDLTDHASFARIERGFPYEVFARLRDGAPVLFHPPGQSADGEGFWVISRHADIAAVAAAPEVFSARGGGDRAGGGSHLDDLPFGGLAGVIVAMLDEPRHALMAQLLGGGMTGEIARAHEAQMRSTAGELIDRALARGECDLATDVCEPYAYLAIALLLGVPPQDRAEVASWAHASTGFIERRSGLPTASSQRTMQATQDYVRTLIARKRADPGEDIATVLATGEVPGGTEPRLSEHDREANLLLLLLTGGEQPRNTLASGVMALVGHPEQWRELRGDPALLPSAREEMLRWAPPNPYNRRTATRDAWIGDTEIKAGDKVTLWWPSGNADPRAFRDPATFDVRRTPNPHLTFGHGQHYCLGNEVARLQFDWLMEELTDRVGRIRPTGPVVYQPSNKHTIVLDMPVRLESAP